MIIYNKYKLSYFYYLENSCEYKKNSKYNIDVVNYNYDFNKKIIRTFLKILFINYSCLPYCYYSYKGGFFKKLIFNEPILIFIKDEEYNNFYKKIN